MKPASLLYVIILLIFLLIGCEKKLTKSSESAKQIKSIHQAATDGDVKLIKQLISGEANVNAKDVKENTPLCHAVKSGKMLVVQLLVEAGADVNSKDTEGRTPLYHAVWHQPDMVKFLITHGADVNAKDNKGQTPLHFVLDVDRMNYRLFEDVAGLLTSKGADVNLKDNDGRTPLHLASESADENIVELLLAKGARIDEKDDVYGFTALHYAARFGNRDITEYLVAKGADINATDKQGRTPLYIAVQHDYKVAELLINKGADSSIKAESGQTLLQLAQERKQMESTVPDMIFDTEPNSRFGYPIACGDIDGDGYDDIAIGAGAYNNKRGRTYLFYGGPDMDTDYDLIFEGENEGDSLGVSISFDDVDNDGYRDIIFGAYHYPGNGSGRAYLYYGNTKQLMDASFDLIFTGEKPKDEFGFAIGCGDVDNDGYGDIIIGARFYHNRKLGQGRAYLYYGGKRSNMNSTVDVIFDAESEGRYYFGQGIVCDDFNNDGHDDVVIGAQGYGDRQGRAYLFYGDTRTKLDTVPDKTFDGEIEYSDYSWVILCGDIDGDNNNDIIIGADHFRKQVGRVYIYWGSDLSGPSTKPGRILTGENPGEWFSEMSCGDVNNDGYDDLVIGAHGYEAGSAQGRAYLYYGGSKKPQANKVTKSRLFGRR